MSNLQIEVPIFFSAKAEGEFAVFVVGGLICLALLLGFALKLRRQR